MQLMVAKKTNLCIAPDIIKHSAVLLEMVRKVWGGGGGGGHQLMVASRRILTGE